MKNLYISSAELKSSILLNCKFFGSPDDSIYVNKNGDIDYRNSSENNSDWMLLLSFYGMGEYVDSLGQYPHCASYQANEVTSYILEDQEVLKSNGGLLNDDGSLTQYNFKIVKGVK